MPGPGDALNGREQQIRLRHVRGNRQAAHHAPVVRRHAASLGIQARLASGAFAHRSRHGLRREWKTPRCSAPPTAPTSWQELAGLRGHGTGPQLAAGRRRHVPAHHPSRSERSRADLHRHLGRGRFPHRRRRQDLEAHQPGPAVAIHSRSRTPKSATACTASRCTRRARTCCSCRSTGT